MQPQQATFNSSPPFDISSPLNASHSLPWLKWTLLCLLLSLGVEGYWFLQDVILRCAFVLREAAVCAA